MIRRSNKRAPAFVGESAEKLIAIENEALRVRSRKEALIDAITRFVGTISFVGVQIAVTACWAVVNAGMIPVIKPFDPFPYPLLSAITSFEAVLIAAFVLMKQNRLGIVADRRDHVNLQVNLLTERRATEIIRILNHLSVHLGIEQPPTPDRQELERQVELDHVIEEVHSRLPGDTIR
jgi:uncharacterized membrane protein